MQHVSEALLADHEVDKVTVSTLLFLIVDRLWLTQEKRKYMI